MSIFTLHDAIQVIDKEIQWCLENPDKTLHPEYQKGFGNGLIQANFLIGEILSLGPVTAGNIDKIGGRGGERSDPVIWPQDDEEKR